MATIDSESVPSLIENSTTSHPSESVRLFTVRQFSAKYPAFPEGGLRHMIFQAEAIGFDKVIRRVGRKILLCENSFFQWIDEQNQLRGPS